MRSIQLRLTVLFIVVTTATLSGFGIYAHSALSNDLEAQFGRLRKETVTRLHTSLPHSVWNNDVVTAQAILAAEMLPHEVQAILVSEGQDQLFAKASKNARGDIVSLAPPAQAPGLWEEAPLSWQNKIASTGANVAIGKVSVLFSRDHIDATLQTNVHRRVIEILVIDLALLLVLTLSLRLVFAPLARLRDALFDLARHEGDDVKELPESQRNEFGLVAQGFNQTLRKLQTVVQRHQEAEANARSAALKTEQAYGELQAAQRGLVHAEKMAALGSLVAGVAHEINTPLGITLTSASVLEDVTTKLQKTMAEGAIRKSEVMEYMETAQQTSRLIVSNVERAALLIQSFKQVAVDQTSEVRRTYVLKHYIDEVISSLRPSIKKSHARVTVVCPDDIELNGYPGSLAQVLSNLVMNALAHAFDPAVPGDITITAAQMGTDVSLTFADNGRGILPNHIDKVFDPFFTTRRGQGGTGLGLNIVHNIVRTQFGGTIEVHSEMGKGTCFSLLFPRISPQAKPKEVQGT